MAAVKRKSILQILSGKTSSGRLSPAAVILAHHLARGPASGTAAGMSNLGGTPRSGGGFLDNLKDFGTGIMNTLSVPSAVVVTGLTNAFAPIQHKPGVSWKNLGGTFRGDKYAGGAGMLRNFGVTDPKLLALGGLGIDIAADPLWFTGVGGATKIPRILNDAAKLSVLGRSGDLARAVTKGREAAKLFPEIGKSPTAESDILRLNLESDLARAQSKTHGVVPALKVGFGKHKAELPLWNKAIFKKDIARVTPSKFKLSELGGMLSRAQDRAKGTGDLKAQEIADELKKIGAGRSVTGLVGVVMTAGNPKSREAKAMIDSLRSRGLWTDTHDKALSLLSKISVRQAVQAGMKTHAEQADEMQRFLTKEYDDTNPLLAAAAKQAQRVDEDLQNMLSGVRQTRQGMAQKLENQRELDLALHEKNVEDIQVAAGHIQNELERKQQQLADLAAKMNHKMNDPSYAARLAPNVKGSREYKGWTPRMAARQAARQRQGALARQAHKLRQEVETLTKHAEELTARAKEAAKPKHLRKLETDFGRNLMKLNDKFTKIEEGTVKRMEKRKEDLYSRLQDLAKNVDAQVASKARVYAANNDLIEFTRGRRYNTRPLEGGDFELKLRKGGSQAKADLDLPEIHAKTQALMNRGTYIKSAPDPDMMGEVRDFMHAQEAAGHAAPNITGSQLPGASRALNKRTAETPFEIVTREHSMEQMAKAGIPEQDIPVIQDELDKIFKFSDKPVAYSKENVPGITYRPELNGYSLINSREREQYDMLLHKNFMEVMAEAVPGKSKKEYKRMWDDLTVTYATKRIPGSPASSLGKTWSGADRISLWTAWLKAWFTVMNPGHYVMNAVGSYFNDLVVGNWRHVLHGFGPNIPGHAARRLGRHEFNFDADAIKKVYKIGEQEMTGLQLATAARLSGLGLGYTQAEIEMVAHIFESKGKLAGVARLMNKFNMDRENADRVWSWMNHMKSGKDPMTSAALVIRAKFDYNAATHFERIWMRNLMLFYTWYKNNLIYQSKGVLARPGIYSTLNHIEHTRPKAADEPTWWKKAGGLYTPFGLLTFGNPAADIYKLNFSQQNFRQNVLGALTPFVQTPIALATNKDLFTGADLSKFADQNVPSPAGYILNPLGIGTPSRAKSGGEKSPAVPWYLAKILKDFSGPYGSSAGALLSNPDAEANRAYGVVPRLTGVRLNPKEPNKWASSLKARNAKKKADATRKANYEK